MKLTICNLRKTNTELLILKELLEKECSILELTRTLSIAPHNLKIHIDRLLSDKLIISTTEGEGKKKYLKINPKKKELISLLTNKEVKFEIGNSLTLGLLDLFEYAYKKGKNEELVSFKKAYNNSENHIKRLENKIEEMGFLIKELELLK